MLLVAVAVTFYYFFSTTLVIVLDLSLTLPCTHTCICNRASLVYFLWLRAPFCMYWKSTIGSLEGAPHASNALRAQ